MNQHFSRDEMKKIDIVEYLEKTGYQPQKIRNNDYWYMSPLREEKEASFKVNRRLNVWFDHGTGEGGNFIDFALLYYQCSFKELLEKIESSLFFHPQTPMVQQPLTYSQDQQKALEPKIKVIAAKPLTSPALCRYLQDRKISLEIANRYCKEVDFELNDKRFYAVGFENKLGGFKLRNQHFKASSSPKDVTQIRISGAKEIVVFEGFTSFLSYQMLHQKNPPLTNFLVLNSLSFFEKCRQLMEKNQKIYLYLDRDEAGMKNTQLALQWNVKYVDRSHLYKNHKDLNDYLISQSQQLKQSGGQRQHL